VCDPSSSFISNPNYNGSRLLKALISNPEILSAFIYGRVNFN